jgi:hypothetical protein
MKKTLIITFLIFIQISCNQKSEVSEKQNDETGIKSTSNNISMINLIASPEKYNGKKIKIIGFVNAEFGKNGVYLSKDDYENSIYKNGILISQPESVRKNILDKNLDKRYMYIEGTFKMNEADYNGPWSGKLERVTKMTGI